MLKLAKLPDRTPVRIVITVSPDLARDLAAYAEAYRQAYGQAEAVADLIPPMLAAFLGSDRVFAKARQDGVIATADAAEPVRRRKIEIKGEPGAVVGHLSRRESQSEA